jgi:hypothetical protein
LREVQKDISLHQAVDAIAATEDAGIEATAYVIVGLPGQDREELISTARFVHESKASILQAFVYHPLPGSEYFREGRHDAFRPQRLEDWRHLDVLREPLGGTGALTRDEVIRWFILLNYAFRTKLDPDTRQAVIERLLSDESGVPCQYNVAAATVQAASRAFFRTIRDGGDVSDDDLLLAAMLEVLLDRSVAFSVEEISDRAARILDLRAGPAKVLVRRALIALESASAEGAARRQVSGAVEACETPREEGPPGCRVYAPRRRDGIVPVFAGECGLYFNPFARPEVDLYRNVFSLDRVCFEVLLRATGASTVTDICSILHRLFRVGREEGRDLVEEALDRFQEWGIVGIPVEGGKEHVSERTGVH